AGAADVMVTVPCDAVPPVMVAGFTESDDSVGAVGGGGGAGAPPRGVNDRTVDHEPAVPAEVMPRTRQKCRCRASDVTVSCEAATIRSTTSGVVKLFESSI